MTTNSMGSGCEVESATFHAPIGDIEPFESMPSGRSGFRGRLDDLKSRGMSKVHDVQRTLGDRRVALKSSLDGQVDRAQTSMKTSPMLWAGVAAGSGFALGLVGRFIHWRNYHRRPATPDLVIIDATC
jgi:ElaB/YqjD/DUF883 family membrane-anchored ribosome-binding protein